MSKQPDYVELEAQLRRPFRTVTRHEVPIARRAADAIADLRKRLAEAEAARDEADAREMTQLRAMLEQRDATIHDLRTWLVESEEERDDWKREAQASLDEIAEIDNPGGRGR